VRLATDIRATLYQAIADLAETALWLPGRYVAEQDRAADILARMSGDLARAATALRDWPGYPLDWPSHSYAAASALATASQREPNLAGRLRAPCLTCRPGTPCNAHGRDLSLLETYHEIAQAAVAVLDAAKCPDGKEDSAAIPQEPAAPSRNPTDRRQQRQPA
jgi:hypothetical protein